MEGRKKQDLIWGDSKLNGDEFQSTERGSDHWPRQQTDCTRFKSLSSSEKKNLQPNEDGRMKMAALEVE